MRTIAAIVLFCVLVLVPVAVYASDLTDADYTGTITITNSGTATTYVATNMTLNSTNFINAEYVDSDMYGAAMITNGGSDAVFMPGHGSNPWCIYVPSISTNTSINYTLYTCATDNLSATKYYFGNTSGMTVVDNADMELSTFKFEIEMDCYFDTSASSVGSDIIFKNQAATDYCRMYVNAAGVCKALIYDGFVSYDFTFNMSSGNHKVEWIRAATGSGNHTVYVDDVYAGSVAIGAAGLADVGANWAFMESPAVIAMHYLDWNVNGSQVGRWEWEYGSTFTDLSGNGHTATPAFRTTTSDADVTAILSSFEPLNPAHAPAYTVEDAPDFYTSNITATGNFSTTTLPDASFPGADVIEDVASESGTPEIWIWGIIGIVTISLGGIGISYARRQYAIGGGYVTVIIIIALLVLGFLVTFEKFDWWMIWFYIITALGLAVASRHIDLGGATSAHGMIGFLAMTWIGLTLINRILEGALLTSSETAFLNTVAFTRSFEVMGMFTIPILNFSFFTEGIPSLLRWDYTFFGGQAQIIQYMLYSITAVVSFIIFGLIIGLVFSYFSRLR